MFAIIHKFKWIYQKFRLSYFLPFIVLVVYTLVGAAIFRHFELDNDEHRRQQYRDSAEYAYNQVLKRMLEVQCLKFNGTRHLQDYRTRETKEVLSWLIDYLNVTEVIEERSGGSPWTWMGSMFYAGQLYTTIGYGLPAAKTAGGRLASIIYIMIGIPIFLIILKEVGKLLSRTLRKLYKRMHSARRKIPEGARKMSEPVKAIYNLSIQPLVGSNDNNHPPSILKKSTSEDKTEENLEEEEMQSKSGEVPILLALTILVFWILISAAMFCLWEHDWGYLTSVYFFFVSISTVGLGDIVPTKPDMMFVNFILILIGLALLSMCVDLVQRALEKFIERLLQEYINEIEKMASIVVETTDYETEEAKPFEVGMTEMLTSPLTTITEHPHQGSGLLRSTKDWIAERIASNVLVSRLAPDYSSSESEDENEYVSRKTSKHTMSTLENGRDDNVSRASYRSNRHHRKRLDQSKLFKYNMPALRAVQAIETVKMRTDLHGSFKSRVFAKFATNNRLTRMVQDSTPAPTKMVSFSVQTSPMIEKDRKRMKPASYGVGLGSMDSFSSSSKRNGADSSTKSFDVDSLCSSAYYDVAFGGYLTDSIPHIPPTPNVAPVLKLKSASPCQHPDISGPPTPTIMLDRSSNSPPLSLKEPHLRIPLRRASEANCLSLPLSPTTLADIWSKKNVPAIRCPSCHSLSVIQDNVQPDTETIKRVTDACGIMPGDFLQHGDKQTKRRRSEGDRTRRSDPIRRSFR